MRMGSHSAGDGRSSLNGEKAKVQEKHACTDWVNSVAAVSATSDTFV